MMVCVPLTKTVTEKVNGVFIVLIDLSLGMGFPTPSSPLEGKYPYPNKFRTLLLRKNEAIMAVEQQRQVSAAVNKVFDIEF